MRPSALRIQLIVCMLFMSAVHPLAGVDLNRLVVLDELLRVRSTTKAAQRLGRTQSAVSHALARLRWTFRAPLFLRARATLRPTSNAEALERRCASCSQPRRRWSADRAPRSTPRSWSARSSSRAPITRRSSSCPSSCRASGERRRAASVCSKPPDPDRERTSPHVAPDEGAPRPALEDLRPPAVEQGRISRHRLRHVGGHEAR